MYFSLPFYSFFWMFNLSFFTARFPSCSLLRLFLLFLHLAVSHTVSFALRLRSPNSRCVPRHTALSSFLPLALHLLRWSACTRAFSSTFLTLSTFIFFPFLSSPPYSFLPCLSAHFVFSAFSAFSAAPITFFFVPVSRNFQVNSLFAIAAAVPVPV